MGVVWWMRTGTIRIERLEGAVSAADVACLAEVLVDAVESGAAVSFVWPLDVERASEWWRGTLEGRALGRLVVLVARDEGGVIVGTVQYQRAWAPNQPHRAEIAKLMVHRGSRGRGVGEGLMRTAEADARGAGVTLLTLDAKRGAAAERLYQRMGWTVSGVIPRFALDPDGKALHDTVIYYKEIG